MREVGYTIGTFYQLFERFDDLVVELNGRTLDELYEICSAAWRKCTMLIDNPAKL